MEIKGENASSDDIEFQPIKPKSSTSIPPKGEVSASPVGEEFTPTESDDSNSDDISSCPICLEPWTSSGRHRICSLKCGHLFGKCCIEKWLAGLNNNGTPRNKCPECNAVARRPDIRILYSKNISVLDPKEKDDLIKMIECLRAENLQLKHMEACLKMEVQMLKNETIKFKSQAPFSGVGEFFICKTANLSILDEACRSLAYSPEHKIFLATCSKSASQHGYTKQSLADPNSPIDFVSLHSKPCKAIATIDNYVATTGADSTLVISSILTGLPLATFQLSPSGTSSSTVGWSCCFESPDIVWAGASNRKLYQFDLAKSAQCFVLEMSPPIEGPPLPIHSLCIVGRYLFGASLAGVFKLDLDTREVFGLKNLSGCFNLTNGGKNLLLASFRRGSGASAEYVLYDTNLDQLITIIGLSQNTRISKSSLISANSEIDLVAIIDESSGNVNVWQCNHVTKTTLLWQKIPISAQPVLDVLLVDRNLLCALGEKSLFLFKSL